MIRVLCVCLGNICRSPTAQGVLRDLAAREAPDLRIEVDSAGTGAYHIGYPPDPRSRRAALARGVDIGDLRARQIALEDFTHFDFLLAMDAANLRDLQALRPAGATAQLRLIMHYAPQLGRLDVPDPYYGDAQAFETVLDLVTAASRGFIAELAATGG
ncbi:MAG TPA: low molecular weight protein-tyrosine-phosphatase [Steroidobacteraceae bacterium]|nr:low molecular weight protein-tyrosine-phosphatase [Steroidobacteraceae bacterium]